MGQTMIEEEEESCAGEGMSPELCVVGGQAAHAWGKSTQSLPGEAVTRLGIEWKYLRLRGSRRWWSSGPTRV